MDVIDAKDQIPLDHIRDLNECPLGDVMMAIAALYTPSGEMCANLAHFNLIRDSSVFAQLILPDDFNASVIDAIAHGHPYSVYGTKDVVAAKWLHAEAVPVIQGLVAGSSVGVVFRWGFGNDPFEYRAYVVDFPWHLSLSANQTVLSPMARKTGAVDMSRLEHFFPPSMQPKRKEGQRGLELLRHLPELERIGQSVSSRVWQDLRGPTYLHSPVPLSPQVVEAATITALRRLLSNPASEQQEQVVVRWQGHTAIAEIKVKGDIDSFSYVPGEQTRIEWQEKGRRVTHFPVAASAELALDHTFHSAFAPSLISRNLLPRFRLLIWTSRLLAAITHGIFIHLPSGEVRLVSLLRFWCQSPSADVVQRVLALLKSHIRFRFAITSVSDDWMEELPERPGDLIHF